MKQKRAKRSSNKKSDNDSAGVDACTTVGDIEDETAADLTESDVKKDDFILGLFEDGAYPGVVK